MNGLETEHLFRDRVPQQAKVWFFWFQIAELKFQDRAESIRDGLWQPALATSYS